MLKKTRPIVVEYFSSKKKKKAQNFFCQWLDECRQNKLNLLSTIVNVEDQEHQQL